MSNIETARQRVAARFVQPYHINAILRGEWDTGSLVKVELEKVEQERAPTEVIEE